MWKVAALVAGLAATALALAVAKGSMERQVEDARTDAIAADDAALHQWWVGDAWHPGHCVAGGSPSDEIVKQQSQGLSPFVREHRDANGFRASVEVHVTGGSSYVVFYRSQEACNAADLADYKADCEKLNSEGYTEDCTTAPDAPPVDADNYK